MFNLPVPQFGSANATNTYVVRIGIVCIFPPITTQDMYGQVIEGNRIPCLWKMSHQLCRQCLIQFVNHAIHPVAKELVHLPHAALAIERSHIQIVAFQMKRGDDVVTNHA